MQPFELKTNIEIEIMKKKQTSRKLPTWFLDVCAVSLFIVIALVFTLGRVGNRLSYYRFETSDAGIISSFAAAMDHPDYFVNDPLLSNPNNFIYYSTIHIPLLRWLGGIIGGYAVAFASLLFPLTFLHLAGYFLLGKALMNNRILALLLTITLFVPVQLNLGEAWGLMHDMIPRFLFQALLPFLLSCVIVWGNNPIYWPLLLGLTGLLVYTHPVSIPAWGLAVFASLWFLAPQMTWKNKIFQLIQAGFVFLLVISPFALNYLSSTTFGSQAPINYEEINNIIRTRFSFIDHGDGYKDFIKISIFSNATNVILWVTVFLGGLWLFIKKGLQNWKWTGNVLAVWWVSIFIVGVLIPIVDHEIAGVFGHMPLEVDLIRSVRYAIPLLILSAFYILSEINGFLFVKRTNKGNQPAYTITIILGVFLMVTWMLRNNFYETSTFNLSLNCWGSGKITCPLPAQEKIDQRFELLNKINEITSIGSRILATGMTDLDIRYISLRPLVYSYKDGGVLIYTNHQDLLMWWQQYQEIKEIETVEQDRNEYLNALMAFANRYYADYLVLPENFSVELYYPTGMKNVFTNEYYSLYQIST